VPYLRLVVVRTTAMTVSFSRGGRFSNRWTKNLPNISHPREQSGARVVRVNDGNDSNVDRETVLDVTQHYEHKFYNTAIARDLGGFPGPVVLTLNPGKMTDKAWYCIDPIPGNLMFTRVRTNT